MIDPGQVDSENLFDILSDNDESRFRDKFATIYGELDIEDSKKAVEATLRNQCEPQHDVFDAIADGFHPYNDEGVETGYEVTLSNPLYEIEETAVDLLLTAHDYQDVHLCFVACETGGENYLDWARNISEVADLVRGHEDLLLDQMPIEGLDIGHVQYVTAAPKEDLPDVDLRYMKKTAPVDEYSIWVVDDDYDGPEKRQVELRKEFGTIPHRQLREVLEDGFDFGKGENTEIGCTLNSHEFIALRETFLQLMINQERERQEHPREFDRGDFERELLSQTQVAEPPDAKRGEVRGWARKLLEIADEADMVYSGSNSNIKSNCDYRLRYPTGMPTQVPEHIRPKYVEYRAPIKMAEDAYELTKEEFEPEDPVKTSLADSDVWGGEDS